MVFSGLRTFRSRINYCPGGQKRAPQTHTFHTANRYGAIWKKTAIQLKINISGFKMCLKQNVSTKKKLKIEK